MKRGVSKLHNNLNGPNRSMFESKQPMFHRPLSWSTAADMGPNIGLNGRFAADVDHFSLTSAAWNTGNFGSNIGGFSASAAFDPTNLSSFFFNLESVSRE